MEQHQQLADDSEEMPLSSLSYSLACVDKVLSDLSLHANNVFRYSCVLLVAIFSFICILNHSAISAFLSTLAIPLLFLFLSVDFQTLVSSLKNENFTIMGLGVALLRNRCALSILI